MKSLIYFKTSDSSGSFEGVRLRKNLKGALELSRVPWVDSFFASPEIVHFISPEDESLIKGAREEGAKIVVSAFYCENDPQARYLEKNDQGGFVLKNKAAKMLTESDLALVPNEFCKDFVRAQGLNCRMEVLSAGVNLARFEKTQPLENNIFFDYFRLVEGTPYVLSILDFDDEEARKSVEAIAFLVNTVRFIVLGVGKRGRLSPQAINKMNHAAPSNLLYSDLVEDDVYRSGLMNAKAVLLFDGSHPDNLGALEAMAAKTQIFALGRIGFPDLIRAGENAYSFQEPSQLAKSLQSYCLGKLKSTIIEGYKTAQANSLIITGEKLKAYYESLL